MKICFTPSVIFITGSKKKVFLIVSETMAMNITGVELSRVVQRFTGSCFQEQEISQKANGFSAILNKIPVKRIF
jgi:hypothetical protein